MLAVRKKLNSMIGLEPVKDQVEDLIDDAVNSRDRLENGLPVEEKTMHMVFSGPPGTGKTTVAEQIAPLYHALGLIKEDKIVKPRIGDMIGPYIGQTTERTQKVLDSAHGGVLFIDEAYGLNAPHYGKEALALIVEDMERHRGDTVVILAGYPHEIEDLVKINPGLRSRLPTTIDFASYAPKAAQQIAHKYVREGGFRLPTPEDRRAFGRALGQMPAGARGNAREIRNLYEQIRTAQARRLVSTYGGAAPKEAHEKLTAADVNAGLAAYQARTSATPRGRRPAKVVSKKPKVAAGR